MQTPVDSSYAGLEQYRQDFPMLRDQAAEPGIVYLDSAATSLKPQAVIDAVTGFYTGYTANVHRAVHELCEQATEAYEGARGKVAHFVHADASEIAFVHNATEAVNLVAMSLAGLSPVALSAAEHHSNLLPWRSRNRIDLPITPNGELDAEPACKRIREERPKLVALSSINNAIGCRNPIEEVTAAARDAGALVLLDVSQTMGHEPVNIQALDCDFACFSGHKMLGPSGVGVLFVRHALADRLAPVFVGGSMVHAVHASKEEYRPFPWNLEPGTPNIEGAIGLGAACDYLDRVGLAAIRSHGEALTGHLQNRLREVDGITVHTPAGERNNIVSFSLRGTPAHGVARMLSNRFRVMVRSGYHCAQPAQELLGLGETVRASLHLYNNAADVDRLIEALRVMARTL